MIWVLTYIFAQKKRCPFKHLLLLHCLKNPDSVPSHPRLENFPQGLSSIINHTQCFSHIRFWAPLYNILLKTLSSHKYLPHCIPLSLETVLSSVHQHHLWYNRINSTYPLCCHWHNPNGLPPICFIILHPVFIIQTLNCFFLYYSGNKKFWRCI